MFCLTRLISNLLLVRLSLITKFTPSSLMLPSSTISFSFSTSVILSVSLSAVSVLGIPLSTSSAIKLLKPTSSIASLLRSTTSQSMLAVEWLGSHYSFQRPHHHFADSCPNRECFVDRCSNFVLALSLRHQAS